MVYLLLLLLVVHFVAVMLMRNGSRSEQDERGSMPRSGNRLQWAHEFRRANQEPANDAVLSLQTVT